MSTSPDLSLAVWVKSSYSGNGGDNCVEWSQDSSHPCAPSRFATARTRMDRL
jgi:Domain of unknown function (DUF397)